MSIGGKLIEPLPNRLPEQWKRVNDTDLFVSEQGRIKHVYKNGNEREVTGYERKKDHVYVFKVNGKEKILARVVWETFRGSIPKGYSIVHIDGNIHHNNIGNLKMMSSYEIGKVYGGQTKRTMYFRDNNTGNVYKGSRLTAKVLNCSCQTVLDAANGKFKNACINVTRVTPRKR